MVERKSYAADQSALYKVKSPAQLAGILRINYKQISRVASAQNNYVCFRNKKGRDIQDPKPDLKRIQKRIADLLARIETPDFLHSARKGRSYVTNARQHDAALPSVKLDIRRFFVSVRAAAVFHFFKDEMQCQPDVAGLLTRLVTVDGHLPTGGNASPILSYFTYKQMFQEIDALAAARGCVMSCLMDDITFTGGGATASLLLEIRQILKRYRQWAHKTMVFKAFEPRVITGVAVTANGLRLPNKRQKAIAQDQRDLRAAQTDDARLTILRRAMGRAYEAAQIDRAWLPRAKAYADQLRAVQRRLAAIQ